MNLQRIISNQTAVVLTIILFAFSALMLKPTGAFVMPTQEWLGLIITLVIVFLALFKAYQKESVVLPHLLLFGLLHILFVTFAAFMAQQLNIDVRWEFYGLLIGLVWFWSLHQFQWHEKQINTIVLGLIFTGAIHGLIVIVNAQLVQTESIGLGGNFYQVNILSSFLASILLLSLWLQGNKGDQIKTLALWLGIFLMSYVIFLTNSRTGLIGLAVGGVLILTGRLIAHNSKQTNFTIGMVTWLLLVFAGFATSALLHDVDVQKFSQLANPTTLTRWPMYLATWELFLQQPWFGHGLGLFTEVFQTPYIDQLANTGIEPTKALRFVTHPHNELLYRLSESGIIGTMGLFALIGFVFYLLYKQGVSGLMYAGLLIPITLHTQTEFPLQNSFYSWLLLLFLLFIASRGFVNVVHINTFKHHIRPSITMTTLAGMLLLGVVYLIDKTTKSKIFSDIATHSQTINRDNLESLYLDSYFFKPAQRMVIIQQAHQIPQLPVLALRNTLKTVEEAFKYYPSPDYYALKSFIFTRLGEFDQAQIQLKKLKEYYPNYDLKIIEPYFLHQSAKAAMHSKDGINQAESKVQAFVEWIKAQPKKQINQPSYQLMIEILRENQQKSELSHWLKAAKQHHPNYF